jgi:hypothetical protein
MHLITQCCCKQPQGRVFETQRLDQNDPAPNIRDVLEGNGYGEWAALNRGVRVNAIMSINGRSDEGV